MLPPIISPMPTGIRKEKFIVEIAFKYNSYIPSNIKITVLLRPGITIPADITIPHKIKYSELIFVKQNKLVFFSKTIKNMLAENVISKQRICAISILLELACFTINFKLPKISPIKAKYVGIGKISIIIFKRLPTIKIPTAPPKTIGIKNLVLFFISLKKLVTLLIIFSYNPQAT